MNEKRGPLPHSPRGHNISHHEMFVSFCSFFLPLFQKSNFALLNPLSFDLKNMKIFSISINFEYKKHDTVGKDIVLREKNKS